MLRIVRLAVLAAMAVALAGCIETKQDYTLNPDGSGKVVVELILEQTPMNFGQTEAPPPDVIAKQTCRQILDRSAGIDAWSDVTVGLTDDGRTRFCGTAYFKDLSKLQFQAAGAQGVSFVKDDKGGMVLTLAGKPPEKAGAAPPPPPTEDQVAQRIQAQRDKFQQMRPVMEMAMAKMKTDFSFRLPGTLAEVSNLQKEPSGAVRIVVEGAKMLQVLDQLMADDAYMRELVVSGGDVGQGGPKLNEMMNEKMLGSKAPIQARVTGDLRPLFPYESEVKAAKDNYPKMIERLGLDQLPAPSPSPMPPGFRGAPGGGVPPGAVPSPAGPGAQRRGGAVEQGAGK